MSLSFTDIPDHQGPAVYMLHDGTITQQRALERLQQDLKTLVPDRQVVILSVRERNGEAVRDFYDITHAHLPYVMIIRDDDQLAHSWPGPHVPTAEHVAYTLKTESAS